KHDVAIVGVDRNEAVLDGEDVRKNGSVVHADGATIANMAAHNFLANALTWQDAYRSHASCRTAWHSRGHGIYGHAGSRGVAEPNENVVRGNRVTRSERYGIAVFPTARFVTFDPHAKHEPGPPWRPHGNRVTGNLVRGSGRADLALAAGSGRGNCFSENSVR